MLEKGCSYVIIGDSSSILINIITKQDDYNNVIHVIRQIMELMGITIFTRI